MKLKVVLFLLFFFAFFSRLFGLGEVTLRIGQDAGWSLVEKRDGVTEVDAHRPWTVLSLIAAQPAAQGVYTDMLFAFDETSPDRFGDSVGNYKVLMRDTDGVSRSDGLMARYGAGAAIFSGRYSVVSDGPLVITPQTGDALFASGKRVGDFSIEFWALPFNVDTGEQMFAWSAVKQRTRIDYIMQSVTCTVSKNRFQWTFLDFFASTRDDVRSTITLSGIMPIIPKTWSHHLIRFDSYTGLLEYLVNGKLEALTYATSTGHESGDVYAPLIGEDGKFVLGKQYVGLLDEVRMSGGSRIDTETMGTLDIAKFPAAGGRIETRSIDLGEPNVQIVRVDASTGRLSFINNKIRNEFAGKSAIRFSDESALQFFIRTSDSPYRWINEWRVLTPGVNLDEQVKGRYVQLAVQFYPSGDGEATPYLDEIRIVYKPDEPPLPPTLVTVIAGDNAVDLSWKNSPDIDLMGYFVYYGTVSGTYFGEGAVLGASPIDVGKRTSIRIDGLRNGTLYYFAVAAYDSLNPLHLGAFSREITARPLQVR
ncbi:MAG: fibronectin type III domain-containing protein [Treponema sp.]|jgi:hypothetical protein|nr:fibronectin type III domain-containing protein [Treponema sp.]